MIKALLLIIFLFIFLSPIKEGFNTIRLKNSLKRKVRREMKSQKKKIKEHLRMVKQYLPAKFF